jgi:hypothetical protein
MQGFGDMLAASPQLRALQGATAQLDGERDPRCLLSAFANMAALARLYWHHSAASRQVPTNFTGDHFIPAVQPPVILWQCCPLMEPYLHVHESLANLALPVRGVLPGQVLAEHAEEMVEVLACYFPIVYTPPPGAPGVITRAELVSGVEAALAAGPTLAPHVIPLVLEKLSSSLRHCSHVAVCIILHTFWLLASTAWLLVILNSHDDELSPALHPCATCSL